MVYSQVVKKLLGFFIHSKKVRKNYDCSPLFFFHASIQKHIPEFTLSCVPDSRQKIADSWPQSIDDAVAAKDWGWKPEYDLDKMTNDMLENLIKAQHEI